MSVSARVIVAQRLSKAYKKVAAVRDFTIEVRSGEIVGILGADGAGKSTALQMLAGVLQPTSGTVQRTARPDGVGYMSEGFSLYPTLTVDQNIDFFANIHRVAETPRDSLKRELFAFSRLGSAAQRQAQFLSGGMQKKLALVCALIHRPDILFLDEPTTGVDPVSRREFWELLSKFVSTGTTIVVTTPYMDEAERFDRVAFMRDGEIIALGTPVALQSALQGRIFEGQSWKSYAIAASLESKGVGAAQAVADGVHVILAEPSLLPQARMVFEDAGGTALQAVQPRLEDVFANLLSADSEGAHKRAETLLESPPVSAEYAITVDSVSKRFGSFMALDNVSFEVRPGEIFGLLGPNGSGKSTLIRIMCGVFPPTHGRVNVAGFHVATKGRAVKNVFGYMSQRFSLYRDLTVTENLDLSGGFYGLDADVLERRKGIALSNSSLTGKERMMTRDLSAGWRQRLSLECAILHRPPVLFLDEPTAGVDPLTRRHFWESIRDLGAAGSSILVTTHYMDEAEHCDRLALLYFGKIIALGSPSQLKREVLKGTVWEVRTEQPDRALAALRAHAGVSDAAFYGTTLRLVVPWDSEEPIAQILSGAGVHGASIARATPTLEDVFVALIREMEESAA